MSLLCNEIGRNIHFGEPLMAGTRSDVDYYSALCKEVIDKIPVSERRNEPCKPEDGGVNIHEASSTRNFNGSYTICGFTLGNFRFSISQKNAELYLPNLIRSYNQL